MKTVQITAAVLTGCWLCLDAAAQDANAIYGRLNVAAERTGGTAAAVNARNRVSNYRSVLGFRGQEDLGDGLYAIFQIEGAVSLDTGTGSIANRDTRVGLRGVLGTAFAGNWTLPYTLATQSFDPFYPTTAGYMAVIGNGSAPSSDNVMDRSSFDRRQQNVFQYWTPAFGPFDAKFAYSFGESVVAATGAKPSLGSASITYSLHDLTITAAAEVHRYYQTARTTDKAGKLGAAYQLGSVRLSGLIERIEYQTANGDLTRNAAYISAVYKTGSLSVLGGLSRARSGSGSATGTVGFFRSGPGTGASQLTAGAEYAFSKRTTAYSFYSRINNDSAGRYDFAINSLAVAPGQSPSVFSVGLRHSF